MKLAFLGTGLMGGAMGGRLLDAGHELRLWNRSRDKADSLAQRGGTVHDSPADAAAGAEIVFVCLSDAAAVESVLVGPGAVGGTVADGALIIDFSTIGPLAAANLANRLATEHGVTWLDCPVSGGVKGATDGTLAIFAGGSAAALARAKPYLDVLAAEVTHMGGAGSGQAAKLCNQLIVSSTLLAIAEAMSLGERLGVDTALLPRALRGGFADSLPLQIFGPRMATPEDPGPKISEIRMMHKDVREIEAAAGRVNIRLPLLETVGEAYTRIIEAGLGDRDLPVLMNPYREEA